MVTRGGGYRFSQAALGCRRCDSGSGAIDREEARREERRLQVLRETGLLEPRPLPEFDALCARARDSFGVATAIVTLIDRDQQLLRARAGIETETTPRSVAFCDHTIRSDDLLVVPDSWLDDRFRDNPLVTGPPFIRFYAGAPLIYLRGVRLGAFCLLHPEPRDLALGERTELAGYAQEAVALILAREAETVLHGTGRAEAGGRG